MSAPTVEYRLDTLETVLAEYIMQQNRNLARLEREMSDFKNEMSDFKNEMSDFKNEMSDFKNEMMDFKNEMSDFKNESRISRDKTTENIDNYVKEGREARKEMNKKWGEVTNKLGTFAEDFVAPNIPRIATDFFKFPSIDIFNRRQDRRNPNDASQVFEFDVFAVCHAEKKILLTDVKFTVRMIYLERVQQTAESFRLAFPEYADYQLIVVFASMAIAPDQVKYLTKMGVYALALGNDNAVCRPMDLLNFENLNQ
jgi:uncharacterized coiled-coil protein SlyX